MILVSLAGATAPIRSNQADGSFSNQLIWSAALVPHSSCQCDSGSSIPNLRVLLAVSRHEPTLLGPEDLLFELLGISLVDLAEQAGQIGRAVHGVEVVVAGEDV